MSWNFHRLFSEVIDTKNGRDSALNWLNSKRLLPSKMVCGECGNEMLYSNDRNYGHFRCRRSTRHVNGKEVTVSRLKGSVFEDCRLPPDRVILLMFCFACDMGCNQTKQQLSYQNSVGACTVRGYFCHFREVICESMLLSSEEDNSVLGGDGSVVEVFETKFKQKKFKSGRITCGLQIFGMFDLGSKQYKIRPCPDGKNDAETLIPLIQKSIAAGTIILTEKWQEYSAADRSKSYQFTNNLSRNPQTGKRLNQKVVASWQPLKKFFPSENMGELILEHLFRYRCKETNCHVFDEFVSVLNMVYPMKMAPKVESIVESKTSSVIDPTNHMFSSEPGLDKRKVEPMDSKDSPMMDPTNLMSSELCLGKVEVVPMESIDFSVAEPTILMPSSQVDQDIFT